MTSLAALVRESFAEETAFAKFRATLPEDDQKALDATLRTLREYNLGAALSSSLTPFETALLLLLVKQNQRVECLEVLLQITATRVVELYGEQNHNNLNESASEANQWQMKTA